jgi:hypothetical protein
VPSREPAAGEQPVPAPRALRALAGLINAALLAAAYWRLLRPRGGAGADPDPARLQRRVRPFALAASAISEQLGTPGGWIVGLRTVDRRTGRRVALWRTLAGALIGVLGEAARRRLAPAPPPISDSEREEFARELRSIRESYPGDGRRLAEASSRFYEQHRSELNRWRWLLPVGPALIITRLRRRLAPTVVVVSRSRPPTARRSGRSRRA